MVLSEVFKLSHGEFRQEVAEEDEKPFYESSGKEDDGEDEGEEGKGDGKQEPKKAPYIMDPDHRLLLRQAKPLLNSRNSAVSVVPVCRGTSLLPRAVWFVSSCVCV